MVGEGVGFQRVRRITGYLTHDIAGWNNAKYAELLDRTRNEVNTYELSKNSRARNESNSSVSKRKRSRISKHNFAS